MESENLSEKGVHGGVTAPLLAGGAEVYAAPVQQRMGQAPAVGDFERCRGGGMNLARSSKYEPPEAESLTASEPKNGMSEFLVTTECQARGIPHWHIASS